MLCVAFTLCSTLHLIHYIVQHHITSHGAWRWFDMLSEAGCQELPPPIASSRTTQLPHIPTHETVSSLSLNLSLSLCLCFYLILSFPCLNLYFLFSFLWYRICAKQFIDLSLYFCTFAVWHLHPAADLHL